MRGVVLLHIVLPNMRPAIDGSTMHDVDLPVLIGRSD
jgi:hypothetical protein